MTLPLGPRCVGARRAGEVQREWWRGDRGEVGASLPVQAGSRKHVGKIDRMIGTRSVSCRTERSYGRAYNTRPSMSRLRFGGMRTSLNPSALHDRRQCSALWQQNMPPRASTPERRDIKALIRSGQHTLGLALLIMHQVKHEPSKGDDFVLSPVPQNPWARDIHAVCDHAWLARLIRPGLPR